MDRGNEKLVQCCRTRTGWQLAPARGHGSRIVVARPPLRFLIHTRYNRRGHRTAMEPGRVDAQPDGGRPHRRASEEDRDRSTLSEISHHGGGRGLQTDAVGRAYISYIRFVCRTSRPAHVSALPAAALGEMEQLGRMPGAVPTVERMRPACSLPAPRADRPRSCKLCFCDCAGRITQGLPDSCLPRCIIGGKAWLRSRAIHAGYRACGLQEMRTTSFISRKWRTKAGVVTSLEVARQRSSQDHSRRSSSPAA